MYTVNITFKVAHEIAAAWKDWMNTECLPRLSADCGGATCQVHSLLDHDDDEGITVVLQMQLPDDRALEDYRANQQQDLHEAISAHWGEKCLFFQTVLKRIK